MNEDGWVLVGVDGTEAGEAAVRYGAEEARRSGARLRLVHVAPDYASRPTAYSFGDPDLMEATHRVGRAMLAEAEKEVHGVVDPSLVSTLLLTGYPVSALVRASVGARMVVLGDQPRPALERIATASVLGGVAGHAPVPVVAVPAGWSPRPGPRRVVVGVKDAGRSRGLLCRALDVAAERGAELVLLHVWQLPSGYGGVVLAGMGLEEWEREIRDSIRDVLKTIPTSAREVPLRIDVRRGQAAHVLVDASREADLLLIARRPHGFPLGHLGATGRAVLRASQCPVEVTSPGLETVEIDPEGER